jgi:hypothetical protein
MEGEPMSDWSDIVATHLESMLTSEVIIRGTEKPEGAGIPRRCIFVGQYGGLQPQSMFSTTEQIHYVLVQVLVRGDAREEQLTQLLANDVYDALRNAAPTGTMVIRPNAPPIRLALDGDSYRFSINVLVVARE